MIPSTRLTLGRVDERRKPFVTIVNVIHPVVDVPETVLVGLILQDATDWWHLEGLAHSDILVLALVHLAVEGVVHLRDSVELWIVGVRVV